MKNIIPTLVILLSFSAIAQNEPVKETEEAEAAYQRMLQRKRENMDKRSSSPYRSRQHQEEKRGEEFDPSKNTIDDDYKVEEDVNED